jgi:hypothetical protein
MWCDAVKASASTGGVPVSSFRSGIVARRSAEVVKATVTTSGSAVTTSGSADRPAINGTSALEALLTMPRERAGDRPQTD